MMPGKTISDWIVEARIRNVSLEEFDTNKKEDMQRLRASELPQLDYFEVPYT